MKKQHSGAGLLMLAGDAYGGFGGIANFNQAFLASVAASDHVSEITTLVRGVSEEPVSPIGVSQSRFAPMGKIFFLLELFRVLVSRKFELIICGHINLLPLAFVAGLLKRRPIVLIIHGIEVEGATHRVLLKRLGRRVKAVISVSELTLSRFRVVFGNSCERSFLLPNSVDLARFTCGPKSNDLISQYSLDGKFVLMTLGRLAGKEREKGFDQVLDVLPMLASRYPEVRYLIVGDGPDRQRLEGRAHMLGIEDLVLFCGKINEGEKIDYFRTADIFVMPSKGEGFGIVILEALACGIPVIGSKVDGTKEALLGGKLGRIVDPDSREELLSAIIEVIEAASTPARIDGLEIFSRDRFVERAQWIIAELLSKDSR